jgi:gliding motility-associated-like protein
MSTRYYVIATTANGCVTMDSVDVIVKAETLIGVPNAFTPGIAPNNELKLQVNGIATLKLFTIYNRWGNKVFETNDINQGWNGEYNNTPQPMGVYVYIVEGYTHTGVFFHKQGNITLIR